MTMRVSRPSPNKIAHNITSIGELHAEIRNIRSGLKDQEQELYERWNRLPVEVLKSTARAAVPVIIDNAIASKTFGLVKGAAGLLFQRSSKNKGVIKESLFSGIKKLGGLTVVRTLYKFLKRK
jgi:hypothetical protein